MVRIAVPIRDSTAHIAVRPTSGAERLASVVQGGTKTTFYVLTVYFGAVGVRRTRHAVACGLAADVAGIVAAILVACLYRGQRYLTRLILMVSTIPPCSRRAR